MSKLITECNHYSHTLVCDDCKRLNVILTLQAQVAELKKERDRLMLELSRITEALNVFSEEQR
jgi:hypothetical protein